MYRSKGHSNDQKLWIKIDLKEIRFYPSGDIVRRYQCRQIELLFKYTSLDIGINFIEGQKTHEIRIPLNHVVGFKVIQNKQIEFQFREDFRKTYYVHLKTQSLSTSKDPTSGCMKDVTKLTFTPCDKVHPMTIFMFEIGIKKWGSCSAASNDDKNKIDENLVIGDSPPLSPLSNIPPSNISEYHVICHFLTYTRAIRLSAEDTLADLLKEMNIRLEWEINSFKYKNTDGEMVTVESEEDWNTAKIGFRKQKISTFDIFVD